MLDGVLTNYAQSAVDGVLMDNLLSAIDGGIDEITDISIQL